jgi:hypothetical protein
MQEPIDFEAASKAWMANKIRKGAMVYYKCQATLKTGDPCKLTAVGTLYFCKRHSKTPTPVRKENPPVATIAHVYDAPESYPLGLDGSNTSSAIQIGEPPAHLQILPQEISVSTNDHA